MTKPTASSRQSPAFSTIEKCSGQVVEGRLPPDMVTLSAPAPATTSFDVSLRVRVSRICSSQGAEKSPQYAFSPRVWVQILDRFGDMQRGCVAGAYTLQHRRSIGNETSQQPGTGKTNPPHREAHVGEGCNHYAQQTCCPRLQGQVVS
jgi:hypothetical protein